MKRQNNIPDEYDDFDDNDNSEVSTQDSASISEFSESYSGQESCPEEGGNTIPPPKNKKMQPRSRNWCYTDYCIDGSYEHDNIKYDIYQIEKCPNTGTLHRQGYLELKTSRDLNWLKSQLCNETHWELRKGSQESAIKYCTKDESRIEGPYEYGTKSLTQGQRTDWEAIGAAFAEGKPMSEVAPMNFNLYGKYSRGFERIQELYPQKRKDAPKVIIITGPSGCGKTRYVYDMHKSVYEKDDGLWWCGYRTDEAILFDEVNYTDYSKKFWCKLLDRYPMRGQVKGGHVEINSPYIYIINSDIEALQPFFDIPDFKRRISQVINM